MRALYEWAQGPAPLDKPSAVRAARVVSGGRHCQEACNLAGSEQVQAESSLLYFITLAHRAKKDDIYMHPLAAKTFASLIHVSGGCGG